MYTVLCKSLRQDFYMNIDFNRYIFLSSVFVQQYSISFKAV